MKRILFILPLFLLLAFTPPTSQNIITITGSVTSVTSLGFERQNVVNGNTNWCDVYYPTKLGNFTVAVNEGDTRTLYVAFTTNTLTYVNDGMTNSIPPMWFPVKDGESLDVDGTVTKIYLKGASSYRIIGHQN